MPDRRACQPLCVPVRRAVRPVSQARLTRSLHSPFLARPPESDYRFLLRGPAPRGYNGETLSGGWIELDVSCVPSPISTRLYDTYPETVKVSRDGKDRG